MIPNNTMTFRTLRIAWSVVCGIACVLMIVLWVRSYSLLNFCEMYIGNGKTLHVQTVNGQAALFVLAFNRGWQAGGFSVKSTASSTTYEQPVTGRPIPGGVTVNVMGLRGGARIPIWVLALVPIFIAPFPWLPSRFSLRTLLIATTLVAVALGVVVYATRQ
jgi:hypothetical protein